MPNFHWRVWVDWNHNGIWNEPGADIAPDIAALHWRSSQWGDADRLTPARLRLTLHNGGGKYTPGNAASPLYGQLQPGRRVWAALACPYDNFPAANGTDLSGRPVAPDNAIAWVKQTSGSSAWVIRDNQVTPQAGSGECIYTLDWGDPDALIGGNYRRAGNGKSGLALRFTSVWDYLRIRFANSGTVLEKVSFGYPTTLRRGPALTAGVNYFLELELHGDALRLFATDLDAGTADRRQILDGQGNAGNLTATRHGIWHDGTAAATADRWANFGGWRSLFYGTITALTPTRDPELGPICQLTAADPLDALKDVELFNLLTGRNLNAAAIANRILTGAGFSPNQRRLDPGPTLIATEPRALWGISAVAALQALQVEANANIYADGRGYLRLESAAHRDAAPHTAARSTFRGTGGNGPYFAELAGDKGGEVENAIVFRYRRAENRGLQEIWRLHETAAIPAGATRDFLAETAAYAAVDRIRVPLPPADYAANSQADGGGTDLTPSLAVSLPYAAAGSGGYSGKGTVIRVANRHATATAYLTLLRLRADRTYRSREPVSSAATDTASQTAYGRRARTLDCRFIDHYAAARQAAASRLARHKDPHPLWTITLPTADPQTQLQIAHRVLSDRIRLLSPQHGINRDFFITAMELTADAPAGQLTARWRIQEI